MNLSKREQQIELFYWKVEQCAKAFGMKQYEVTVAGSWITITIGNDLIVAEGRGYKKAIADLYSKTAYFGYA
jgi:hypothetical protein